MTVHARIDASKLSGVTTLYHDFVASTHSSIRERLPAVYDGGDTRWGEALARRRTVDVALRDALRAHNAALGVAPALLAKLDGICDGSVCTVVTGQQPGVLGGPLMSLYKAAAAVALARHVESRFGRPCLPMFWLGADDDDFAEVRDLSVLGADYSRLDVSMDGSAYRPGLRVGDMSAASLRSVWDAVAASLPEGPARDRLAAALTVAEDFADGAARALVASTQGQLVVVDARTPLLKTAGRDLLLRFFDDEARLRDMLERDSRVLVKHGYHAQIQWGADAGVFVVEDGVRMRIPPAQRAVARERMARDITVAAPGVIARNLLQDAVLAPVAVVLGPAEIAYRAQMAGLYADMGVPMPLVAPRLSATYLPPAVRDMVVELGLDGAAVVSDAAALASSVSVRGGDDGLKAAATAFEATFSRESGVFLAHASACLDARARAKLEKRLDEIFGRLSQATASAVEQDMSGPRRRWPFLPRMADMFMKDSLAQERFLSLVVPMLYHQDDAWHAIDGVAEQWTADALDGRVWHGVYSVR